MKNTTLKLLNDAVFETLEGRQMMSASPLSFASLNNGVLNITGSQTKATRVMVDLAANNSQIVVDVSGHWANFPAAKINKLSITTGSGSDYIYINPHITIPSVINSGDGDDSVRGGGGNNSIIAGNGDDLLKAEGTNNYIKAGDGNDIILGAKANNTLIAGNGNDYLSSLGQNDVMTAGNGNDTFVAGNGHDKITAGTGHDVKIGGLGNSYLFGKSTGTGPSSGSSSGSSTSSSGTGKTTGTGSTANTSTGSTSSGSGTKSGGSTTTGTGSTTSTGGSTGSTGTSSNSSTGTKTTGGSSSSTGTNSSTGSTSTGGSSSSIGTNSSTGSTSTGGSSSTGSGSTGSSGSSGSTVSTGSIGSTSTNVVLPVKVSSGKSPTAVLKTMSGPRTTGIVVNVDGLSSTVGTGTCITSYYAWDFGDAGSTDNQLSGFNAAHVYDKAGTYTISLTVTNEAGLSSTSTQKVTIAASTRAQIYVDSSKGSDSNRGTQDAPLQSLAAAFAQLGDNTEILLKAGESFYTNSGVKVASTNVLIGRYGTGANPQIMRTLGGGLPTISVSGVTNGLTIQDITFNSPYAINANGIANKIGLGGIFLAGSNATVRDCQFLNVDDAINENGNPVGVLVQDNTAPLVTGIRGYFVWGQGSQDTIVGNTVANSTREHIVRCVNVSELNVQGNNFSNLNRQNVDTNDFSKGCIEVHVGAYDWVVNNNVTGGDIRVGPLGLWGEPASDTTSWCVIEDNQLTNTMIFAQSGTQHAMIANNVINNTGLQAIVVSGTDAEGEFSSDITIVNNTGIDTGTQGSFLELLGYANGIVMNNNVFIAPKLQLGAYSASPVRVTAGWMSDFSQVNGNIWASPVSLGTYANGGVNLTGQGTLGNGYVTPDQWNALSNVGTDLFQNVTLKDTYQITIGSTTAGSPLKMAA